MKAALLLLVASAACAGPALCSPILGVPAYSFEDRADDEEPAAHAARQADDGVDFAHLVVTTASSASRPTSPPPTQADDVVSLDSAKERSRFLATLLMLQSLHDKPYPADPKLKKMILADEDLMQEVLKMYETQQETKGKHYIKIPPKLMKKMKKKMKELLSE